MGFLVIEKLDWKTGGQMLARVYIESPMGSMKNPAPPPGSPTGKITGKFVATVCNLGSLAEL